MGAREESGDWIWRKDRAVLFLVYEMCMLVAVVEVYRSNPSINENTRHFMYEQLLRRCDYPAALAIYGDVWLNSTIVDGGRDKGLGSLG